MTRQWNRNPLQNTRHMREQRAANNQPEHPVIRERQTVYVHRELPGERPRPQDGFRVQLGADISGLSFANLEERVLASFDPAVTRDETGVYLVAGGINDIPNDRSSTGRHRLEALGHLVGSALMDSVTRLGFARRFTAHKPYSKAGKRIPSARKLARSVAGEWVARVYGVYGNVEFTTSAKGPQLPFAPYRPPPRRTYVRPRPSHPSPETASGSFRILKDRRGAGFFQIDPNATIRFLDPV